MGNRALISVNGGAEIIVAGAVYCWGVKLLEVGKDGATLQIDGKVKKAVDGEAVYAAPESGAKRAEVAVQR